MMIAKSTSPGKIFAFVCCFNGICFVLNQSHCQLNPQTMHTDPPKQSKPHHWSNSIIRMTEGASHLWKIVDWEHPITDEEEAKFNCVFTHFVSASSGKTAPMCVHSFPDIVSDVIKREQRWPDCNILPKLWNEGNHDDSLFYLEIGANIGSCVLEMLLGTEAKIVAFEPNPINLYPLKKTVSQLSEAYKDRLVLFPVGLGAVSGNFTIHSASTNMGNSVVGKAIGGELFEEKNQFAIRIERLDSLLKENNMKGGIKLSKIDAQGFECNIFEGMGEYVAKMIALIKFEWADQWLHGQGCTDLLQRMNKLGFHIYREYSNGQFINEVTDGTGSVLGENVILDLFASKKRDWKGDIVRDAV